MFTGIKILLLFFQKKKKKKTGIDVILGRKKRQRTRWEGKRTEKEEANEEQQIAEVNE